MRKKNKRFAAKMAHTLPPEACDNDCTLSHHLWPINSSALAIWQACQRQLIVGPAGGVLGLRHESVWAYVNALEARGMLLESGVATFEKMLAAEAELVEYSREKLESKGK